MENVATPHNQNSGNCRGNNIQKIGIEVLINIMIGNQ